MRIGLRRCAGDRLGLQGFQQEELTVPRALYKRLQDLGKDRLLTVMDELLTHAPVRAMLARRDALLDKTKNDIQARGEQAVFQD